LDSLSKKAGGKNNMGNMEVKPPPAKKNKIILKTPSPMKRSLSVLGRNRTSECRNIFQEKDISKSARESSGENSLHNPLHTTGCATVTSF